MGFGFTEVQVDYEIHKPVRTQVSLPRKLKSKPSHLIRSFQPAAGLRLMYVQYCDCAFQKTGLVW